MIGSILDKKGFKGKSPAHTVQEIAVITEYLVHAKKILNHSYMKFNVIPSKQRSKWHENMRTYYKHAASGVDWAMKENKRRKPKVE
jgi:hypothetical protein